MQPSNFLQPIFLPISFYSSKRMKSGILYMIFRTANVYGAPITIYIQYNVYESIFDFSFFRRLRRQPTQTLKKCTKPIIELNKFALKHERLHTITLRAETVVANFLFDVVIVVVSPLISSRLPGKHGKRIKLQLDNHEKLQRTQHIEYFFFSPNTQLHREKFRKWMANAIFAKTAKQTKMRTNEAKTSSEVKCKTNCEHITFRNRA